MPHLQTSTPKTSLFLHSLRPISLLEWSNSIYPSAEAASFLLQCPHLVIRWTAQLLRLHLNHLSACQCSSKISLRMICANLWGVPGGVMVDNVLGLYHFGVLCLSPIILFKMCHHFLKAWTADRANCCPQWHGCHPYFFFVTFYLTLRLYLWESVAMTTLSSWWGSSIQCVWQSVQLCADGQPDSCPCWILLSPPGEAEQDEQINFWLCVCVLLIKS